MDVTNLFTATSKFKAPTADSTKDGPGVMIALLPAGDTSWCRQDLPHCTLVYVGDNPPLSMRPELEKASSSLAETFPIFVANIVGVDILGPADNRVDVMLLDSPRFRYMREAVEQFNGSEYKEFKPHATIGPHTGEKNPIPLTLRFDRVILAWGEDRVTWFLHGEQRGGGGGQFAKGGGRVPGANSKVYNYKISDGPAEMSPAEFMEGADSDANTRSAWVGEDGTLTAVQEHYDFMGKSDDEMGYAAAERGYVRVSMVPGVTTAVEYNNDSMTEGQVSTIRQVHAKNKNAVLEVEMDGGYKKVASMEPMSEVTNALRGKDGRSRRRGELRVAGKGGQFAKGGGRVPAGASPLGARLRATLSPQVVAGFEGGSAMAHLESDGAGGMRFTEERAAFHQKIIEDRLAGIPKSSDPTYQLVGGGPASGKSTFVSDPAMGVPTSDKALHANADELKKQLPEYSKPETFPGENAAFTHEESSYLVQNLQTEGFARRVDVVFDGTGDSSAQSIAGKANSAKAAGYKVKAKYLTVPTDVAVSRNIARSQKDGPDKGRLAPESVVRGTHIGVSKVFPSVATTVFDTVELYDTNTGLGSPARLLASGTRGGKLTVHDQQGYDDFLAKGDE